MPLPLFSFDPSKGETLETLKRRRQVAEAMLANIPQANTIGGGLAALGQAIGGRLALGRANRGIAAGQAGAASRFGDFMGGIGGGTPDPGGAAAVTDVLAGSSGGDTLGGGDFSSTAASVIPRLSKDLGISEAQAAGIVGQLGHESEGLKAINERQPTVPGSRGGFGWAQWTGPRRTAFERWAADKGLSVTSPEANYGFLVHELKETPEGNVLAGLRQAPDAITAGRIFTQGFLRPGKVNQASRDAWTRRAMGAAGSGGGAPAVTAALAGGAANDTLGVELPAIDPAAKDDAYPATTGIGSSVPAAAAMIDPAAKDDLIPESPAFTPAGGATPYPDDLGTSDPAYRKMVEERPMSGITVPQTPGAVPLPPVTAPVAPPVAPAVPAAPVPPGVAPVAKALGVDPLPQTSGLMGPVASAGHESLSPGVGPVSAALSGGGGANTLTGGGGRGIIGRLFGGGGPRPAAGGAPNPVATAMSGGAGAAGPAGTPGAPGGGGLSDTARKAIAVIQDPWSNEGQLAVAKEILGQEIKQLDPRYRVELEAAQEALRQAQTPTRAMTDAEKRDAGIDPTINARIDAKGNVTEGPKVEPKIIGNTAYHPTTGQPLWTAPPGTKILSREEAIDHRLDPDLGTWTIDENGVPDIVEGTERKGIINVGGGVLYDQDEEKFIQVPEGISTQEVKLTDESSLRKELADQIGTSRYRFSQPILSGMVASLYDNNTASDFQYIYGVAQIFDPNSVVRTEEGKQVIDSQSIPEAIKGRLNQLLNMDSAIGVTARRDLIATGARRIAEYNKQATGEATFFGNIAKDKGIKPENIVFPLEAMPEAPIVPPPDAITMLVNGGATKENMEQFDKAFGDGSAEAYLIEAGVLEAK